jgi:amidase
MGVRRRRLFDGMAAWATTRGTGDTPMAGLAHAPAHRQLAALSAGEVSARELLDLYLSRVQAHDPAVNAVVALDTERAMRQAARADRARARGEDLGPLHGLPMTVKDSIETEGLRTTCGTADLAHHVPRRDATAVARLRSAGAVIFGKTNTPAFEMASVTDNDLFGLTRNPWDPGRTTGGSSGGSAAALAAGLTALELGADDAGSNRMPAHFCGVYGHKPSYGVVPTRGHIPPAPGSLARPDLGVLGPLARSATDLTMALRVLTGPDDADARAWRLSLPAPAERPFRLAYWFDDPHAPIDDDVRPCLENAIAALASAGCRPVEVYQPVIGLREHQRMFAVLDDSLFCHLMPDERYARLRALAAGDGEAADRARAATVSKRDWNLMDERRHRLRAGWAEFFESFDALLTPVVQTTAFPHPDEDERRLVLTGEARPYPTIVAWVSLANSCHLPATAVPVGLAGGRLPVGIQVIGPYLGDLTTLAVAAHLEELLPPVFPNA